MNTQKELYLAKIKNLIEYLKDIYNKKDIIKKKQEFIISKKKQDAFKKKQEFFISKKELDEILEKYFLYFENKSEAMSAIQYNYNLIKYMSFPHGNWSLYHFIDEENKRIPDTNTYLKGRDNHAHTIHSHLMEVFEKKLGIGVKKKHNSKVNRYSLKEVKIAYFCLGEMITNQNYSSILKTHTVHTSNKILQNPITKNSDLTAIRENKAADTKHLKSLEAAKRLLSGIKNQSAIKTLNQAISTFESNCSLKYD